MNIENINLMGTEYINRGFNCVLICSTSADTATKTVSAPSAFALDTNCSFKIKFTNGNTAAAPTLAINTTGAKSLTFLGSSTLKANLIYECYFDGTNYVLDNSVTEASVASANKLTTARKTYVTLGTASTTTTRDWSGDTTIPVDGTLPVKNGGTGATSLANITVGNSSKLGNISVQTTSIGGSSSETGAHWSYVVKAKFTSTSGYIVYSNGLIIQWGWHKTDGNWNPVIRLHIAYSSGTSYVASENFDWGTDGQHGNDKALRTFNKTASQFTVWSDGPGSFCWIAIGY